MKKTLSILVPLFFSQLLQANSVEFALFDQIVSLGLNVDLTNAYEAEVNYTHSQQDDIKCNLVSASFFARGVRDQMTGKVGAKPFLLTTDNTDTFGLAVGGGMKYMITPLLWTEGEIFYAPEIIVGGDFESYYDVELKLGYNILPHASVLIAYQNFGADTGKETQSLYNGVKLGINFKF